MDCLQPTEEVQHDQSSIRSGFHPNAAFRYSINTQEYSKIMAQAHAHLIAHYRLISKLEPKTQKGDQVYQIFHLVDFCNSQ